MSRSSKRARQGKTKILIKLGVASYLCITSSLFVVFDFQVQYASLPISQYSGHCLNCSLSYLVLLFNSVKESSKSNVDFITTWCVNQWYFSLCCRAVHWIYQSPECDIELLELFDECCGVSR